VYACAIDVSKAFDKVNRAHLWLKLFKKGAEPLIVLALMKYYGESYMLVMKEQEVGELFKTTVGVRQGGVVSPKLFSIYMDGLIGRIESLNVGVDIGAAKVDVLLYADDVVLVCRTRRELQIALDETEKYGKLNDMKFNALKTNFMVFNEKSAKRMSELELDSWQGDLKLNGEIIKRVSLMKYLGYWINESAKYNEHFNKRKTTNVALIATMKSQGLLDTRLSVRARVNLFHTFIRSTLYYGSENYLINETLMKEIRKIEGNFIKSLVEMPNRCHTTELMNAMGILEPSLQLEKIKFGFLSRVLENVYTAQIINEEAKLGYAGTFTYTLAKSLYLDPATNLSEITNKAKERLVVIERIKMDLKKPRTGKVGEIVELLDKCDVVSRSKLFELIKH
jgi:hypothetical protein